MASSRTRRKASISSVTVSGRKALRTSGRSMVILATPGARVLEPDVGVGVDGGPGGGHAGLPRWMVADLATPGPSAGQAASGSRKLKTRRPSDPGRSRWGAWPAPSTISRRAPGIDPATTAARSHADRIELGRPPPASGAAIDPSRSWTGSAVPCPAPRRLAARPIARLRRRCGPEPPPGRRRAERPAWRGSAAPPRRRRRLRRRRARASRPCASSAGPAVASEGRVRDPGRGALQDQAADRGRVVDGDPQGDPGAHRVADHDRPAGHRAGRAGRRDRRPADRRRTGRDREARRTGRDPAGPRTIVRWPLPRSAVGSRPQLVPRPLKPWRKRTGGPPPRTRVSRPTPSTTSRVTRRRPGVRRAPRSRRPPQRPPPDGARRCAPDPSGARGPGPPADRARPPPPVRAPRGPTRRCSPPRARHDRADIDPVGRAEQRLVALGQTDLGSVGRGLGQEREDPAPVVVHQDDRRREGVEAGRDEGVEVVQEREVADDQDDRTDARRGRPEGRRDDPVDPVRAPVAEAADRARARRAGSRRGRGPACCCRRRGWRRRSGPGRPRRSPRPRTARRRSSSQARSAASAARSAASQAASQPCRPIVARHGRRRPARRPSADPGQPLGQDPGQPHRVGVDDRRRAVRRLVPAAVVDDELVRFELGQPAQERLRGRRAAEPDDEVRPVRRRGSARSAATVS